jgi:hypothetical protein
MLFEQRQLEEVPSTFGPDRQKDAFVPAIVERRSNRRRAARVCNEADTFDKELIQVIFD